MPRNTPPTTLDVLNFARHQGELSGELALSELPRVQPLLAAAGSPLAWKLHGVMHEQPWLQMALRGGIPLTCQRCLEPVELALDLTPTFRFVADETTAELEDERSEEEVLAITPSLDTLELLEDEILLALPLIPRHEDCPTLLPHSAADPQAQAVELEDKKRPFEGLAQLLTKKQK